MMMQNLRAHSCTYLFLFLWLYLYLYDLWSAIWGVIKVQRLGGDLPL